MDEVKETIVIFILFCNIKTCFKLKHEIRVKKKTTREYIKRKFKSDASTVCLVLFYVNIFFFGGGVGGWGLEGGGLNFIHIHIHFSVLFQLKY